MSNKRGRGLDQLYVEALNHPVRRQILRLWAARRRAISPSQASKALESPLSNLSYHFRVLRDYKVMVLEETQAAGGSLEHFYAIDASALQSPIIERCLNSKGASHD